MDACHLFLLHRGQTVLFPLGIHLPEAWGVKILRDLPIELPGQTYRDFYRALRAAAKGK